METAAWSRSVQSLVCVQESAPKGKAVEVGGRALFTRERGSADLFWATSLGGEIGLAAADEAGRLLGFGMGKAGQR